MFWELTFQHLQLFINKWKTEDQKASLCVRLSQKITLAKKKERNNRKSKKREKRRTEKKKLWLQN